MGEKMNGENTTVLVVEDEAPQREMLISHLQSQGYDVLAAENGRVGLDLWEQYPGVRLVITDLNMPEVGGLEVVETIRAKEDRYTYIMVITHADDKDALLKGLSLGADDFLHKPLVEEELVLRLTAAARLLRLEDHDRLVVSLAELAAARSGELSSHLKRTKEYCFTLAEDLRRNHPEFELTEQSVVDLANISVLHDIGKIGIPDGLLSKRGRLTDKEYVIMHKHPVIGANKIKELLNEAGSIFLKTGYDLVMTHHEKWDGTGYPQGLKGDEIPICGRIMILADTYDALRTRKTYKDAFPLEHVESIIENERGKQFDPLVLDSYFRSREKFMDIHEKYPDSPTRNQ